MAEEWDLSAIVRSYQPPTTTATTEIPLTTTTTTTTNTISPQHTTVKEEYDAFSFPNLLQPIITNDLQDELNQLLLTPFNPSTSTTTTSGAGINPDSPDSSGCIGQHERQQQLEHLPHPSIIWPRLVPEASTSCFNRFHDQHQSSQQQNQLQLVQKQESQVLPQISSGTVLPDTQPQTPRSRKRRSQQKRMVCHVKADNLSADMWAWRKYGQKPIKGSPYPRNYYRCSSSKVCSARKQVERSNEEPNMFIITYNGDHNHPRPTHRNSLAGSTRCKPSTPATHGSPSFQASTTVVVASPPSSAHLPQPENEEIEPESPDPGMETDVDAEVDTEPGSFQPNSDDIRFNPG